MTEVDKLNTQDRPTSEQSRARASRGRHLQGGPDLVKLEVGMALPAPSPIHLLRLHSCAVSTLFISTDNERLYSGDGEGQVVITSTRSLRPLASWKAHSDALLGVEEWGSQIMT